MKQFLIGAGIGLVCVVSVLTAAKSTQAESRGVQILQILELSAEGPYVYVLSNGCVVAKTETNPSSVSVACPK